MRSIGNIIKERREQVGMSATELAKALGITTQAVWNWENDSNRSPGREVLAKLSDLLDLKIEEILPQNSVKTSVKEQEALLLFRQLSPEEQDLIIRMLRGAVKRK